MPTDLATEIRKMCGPDKTAAAARAMLAALEHARETALDVDDDFAVRLDKILMIANQAIAAAEAAVIRAA